ncbi:MAG: tRNA (adenosine(37)-N6)-threonylcarbamoyltransferase complex ATPase subunit type 1 TsaE [Lachnospiraceae bacterium]|nr:tRNA (adenosine(37)-N6)-threonylcarbamoyltransferase complex ATPase subunit type 1 TsaE [Lachnospiraceae bacterium]
MKKETSTPEETKELAISLAKEAKAGDIILLHGDLGVGKTVFSQGFAQGLKIEEPIQSPTFTILQEYDEGTLPFYHFDVYRISDPEEMYEIGFQDYLYGNGVCLIEWASKVEELLPEKVIEIKIEKNLEKGFDYRMITITYPEERKIN